MWQIATSWHQIKAHNILSELKNEKIKNGIIRSHACGGLTQANQESDLFNQERFKRGIVAIAHCR